MVHIMITMWWPPTKNRDVAKKVIEGMKKFPPDESLFTTLAQGMMGDKMGVKAITIANVKDGKLVEALTLAREMLRFYEEIEGLTSKIDLMTTPEEGFAALGMKRPE